MTVSLAQKINCRGICLADYQYMSHSFSTLTENYAGDRSVAFSHLTRRPNKGNEQKITTPKYEYCQEHQEFDKCQHCETENSKTEETNNSTLKTRFCNNCSIIREMRI